MNEFPLTPSEKALRMNQDAVVYGTFAEIGAGQEVVRWFFHVGGASGTVAKTISAYDMVVSDAIYGRTERYVSRKRLEAMLVYEYDLLLERLGPLRGDRTAFFAFADTAATRSRSRNADGHGWVGVRFQTVPRAEPSQLILHVTTHDTETAREREAIGLIGVNLLYGAVYQHSEPEALLASLLDNLSRERVEIDMIKFSGPAFANVDNCLMSLRLVEHNFTDSAMFTAAGEVVQPAEVLYQRPILIERGRFRPVNRLTWDLLQKAHDQFCAEPDVAGENPVSLVEISVRDLPSHQGHDERDFLDRVDVLRRVRSNGADFQPRAVLPACRAPVTIHAKKNRNCAGRPVTAPDSRRSALRRAGWPNAGVGGPSLREERADVPLSAVGPGDRDSDHGGDCAAWRTSSGIFTPTCWRTGTSSPFAGPIPSTRRSTPTRS